MRNIYFLTCILLSAGAIGFLSPFFDIDINNGSGAATFYATEIAKYEYPVHTDSFDNIEDVTEISGKHGNYHYLAGVTQSKSEAEKLVKAMRSIGYSNAKLVDLSKEFSEKQLAATSIRKNQKNKLKKNTKQDKQEEQNKKEAIGKFSDKSFFYSILLLKSNYVLELEGLEPLEGIKVLKVDGQYHYLYGRFEKENDALQYLNGNIVSSYAKAEVVAINNDKLVQPAPEKLSADKQKKMERKNRTSNYAKAKVVVINKEKLTQPSPEKTSRKKFENASRQKNMGRKMRGKEYVDYYFEINQHKLLKQPIYQVELGSYYDLDKANEAVNKLKKLGFDQAGIRKPGKQSISAETASQSAGLHYTIQVFASKSELKTTHFNLEGVIRNYDQHDELYRFFYGNYDNYWVCRRELREIRKKGFVDAFIVKL